MELLKIAIFVVLAAVVLSLGSALYYLATGQGDSKKMMNSLIVRISLSLALFVLLMVGWKVGLIRPHGIGR
jgi:hypothetical protein